jgi:hypothetical protein
MRHSAAVAQCGAASEWFSYIGFTPTRCSEGGNNPEEATMKTATEFRPTTRRDDVLNGLLIAVTAALLIFADADTLFGPSVAAAAQAVAVAFASGPALPL